MTAVLLLGAGGFLGRHIHRAFLADDWDVTEGPSRRRCDLADLTVAGLARLTAGMDVVVNATGAVTGDDRELARTNVDLVARLVAACPPATRLVQLGSLAEYGPGRVEPWRERDDCRPVSAYGRSKARGSDLVLAATAAGDADAVVLRIANPVGERQPETSVLGRVATAVRADPDGEVTVGALDGLRDFVSACDVARAVVVAAGAALPARHRVFNVGTGHATSVREAVRQLLVLTDFRGLLREIDVAGSTRSASVDCSVADPSLAREHLGWSASDSLSQALSAVAADCARVPA